VLALVAPRRLPARSEFFWTLGLFLAFTAFFVVYVEMRHPEWYDREYQVRRGLLNDRITESPERPVVLVIGSSRLVAAVLPERLGPIRDTEGREVTVFNYCRIGAGPRMNLVQLHRAIRDGVRPSYLVLELVPGFLRHDDLPVKEIAIPDVGLLWKHSNKLRLVASTAGLRLNGVYRPRTALLRSIAPEWETRAEHDRGPFLSELGGDNNWVLLEEPSKSERELLHSLAVGRFQNRMQTFRFDPYLVSAMRELLEECKSRGIKVAIVLTPEDSEFLSWYRPGAEEELQVFLANIRANRVPVFDSRRWMTDDKFTDPHHLKRRGAEEYTERLGKEVLIPFVGGK